MAELTLVVGVQNTGKTTVNVSRMQASEQKELMLSLYSEPVYADAFPNITPAQVREFCEPFSWKKGFDKNGEIIPIEDGIKPYQNSKAVCGLYARSVESKNVISTALNFMNTGGITIDDASSFAYDTKFNGALVAWLATNRRKNSVKLTLVYHSFNSIPAILLDEFWTEIRLHKTTDKIRHNRLQEDMLWFLSECQKQINVMADTNNTFGGDRYVYGIITRAQHVEQTKNMQGKFIEQAKPELKAH